VYAIFVHAQVMDLGKKLTSCLVTVSQSTALYIVVVSYVVNTGYSLLRSQAVSRFVPLTAYVTFEPPGEAGEGLVYLLRHQTARWTQS